MSFAKEFTDKSGNPVVLVTSFFDQQRLCYMVDDMTGACNSMIFDNRTDALDYGKAITNRINRNK